MQAQRYWIEKAFGDQKGELGMSNYQIRKYLAWYMEKEIDKMIVRHHQRINDINRYYPDNDYF